MMCRCMLRSPEKLRRSRYISSEKVGCVVAIAQRTARIMKISQTNLT
ncbi:MAG: hypothetical protein WBA39_23030 [Rivularia sp. (in: cyanobacteria)]